MACEIFLANKEKWKKILWVYALMTLKVWLIF